MNYYGLHFTCDDETPFQVIFDAKDQSLFARYAPQGGEWTPWRRLDVSRNADGTLNEIVQNAIYAQYAGAADKLTNVITITLSGPITGHASLDGTGPITLNTSLGSGFWDAINNSVADIRNRLGAVEASLGGNLEATVNSVTDLKNRLAALESQMQGSEDIVSKVNKTDARLKNLLEIVHNHIKATSEDRSGIEEWQMSKEPRWDWDKFLEGV